MVATFDSSEKLSQFVTKQKERGDSLVELIPSLLSARVALSEESSQGIPALRTSIQEAGGTPSYNFPISTPRPPEEASLRGSLPFREHAAILLGIPPNNSSWGEGITIGVLDSWVEEHRDFSEKNIARYSLLEPRDTPVELTSHGTAITSLLLGSRGSIQGIAPAAMVIAVEVLDDTGAGDAFTVAEGILFAMKNGADIINMSLGTFTDVPILRAAVRTAAEAGVLLVAAAGNEGGGRIPYPAAYDEVLAVTALDAAGRAAPFGNTAEAIDLGAPGVGVLTAHGREDYILSSGSSVAAPFVTGTVAALLSSHPGMKNEELKKILFRYADDLGTPGRDPVFGEGRLNVKRIWERERRNVRDIAISGHILDRARITEDEIPLLITVENRGTTEAAHVQVIHSVDGRERENMIQRIRPTELGVIEIPIRREALLTAEGVSIESRVIFEKDSAPENNRLTSRLRISR
ncbi:S8 family serine peptidase [bacterium]|nr:S8 family serine peptidase [bacterium]